MFRRYYAHYFRRRLPSEVDEQHVIEMGNDEELRDANGPGSDSTPGENGHADDPALFNPFRRLSNVKLKKAALIARNCWRGKELKKILAFANLGCKCEARFSLDDLKKTEEYVLEEMRFKRIVLCARCGSTLQSSTDLCRKQSCPLFMVAPRGSVRDKRIVVEVVDCMKQLEYILILNMGEVITSHRKWCEQRCTKARSDCRDFQLFRSNLESAQEFKTQTINVQLILSADGFCFKGHQRGSSWVISCKIMDLPKAKRRKSSNTLIAAIVSGGDFPRKEALDIALSELKTLLSNPIMINYDGQLWTVRVLIKVVVMDQEAIAKCFRIKGASGYYGCYKCYHPGIYSQASRRMTWPRGCYRERTAEGCIRESNEGTHGFHGPSPFSSLIPASENIIDYLHCFQEGVMKKFLQGGSQIHEDNSAYRTRLLRCSFKDCLKTLSPIRVSSADRVLLEDMVTKASLPTYVRNFLRSPSDVNRLSGSELELLAMAIVPVAAAEGLIPCKRRAAVLLQSVIIGSILQNCPMSKRLALVLQRSLNFCSRLFDESFGRDFAFFKKHLWFDHAADDIVYRGNPSEFSTSMFESEYRLMKRGIRLGNTRCPSGTAFILHLYRLVVAVEMEIRGERNEVESLPLVKSSMEDGTPHMRSQVQYRDEPSFNVLRQCGCNVFFTRLIYHGRSYSSYLRRSPSNSQQHVLVLSVAGTQKPAKCLLFGKRGDDIFVAVEMYSVSCPFQPFISTLRSLRFYDFAKAIVWCSKFNRFFYKVSTSNPVCTFPVVFPVSCIRGPGVFLNYGSQSNYVMLMNNVGNPE